MKPKKKKAGKKLVDPGFNMAEVKRLALATDAFWCAVDKTGMEPNLVPSKMVADSIRHLAYGKPLVFTQTNDELIICDPKSYVQFIVK